MKRLLGLSLLVCSMNVFSQSSNMVRPTLGMLDVTDGSGKSIAASSVGVNQQISVVLPVYNNSAGEVVKAGSGSIEVDLGVIGSNMLQMVDLPVSNNFSWEKPISRDGHMFITGRLVSNLAPQSEYSETLLLKSSTQVNTRLRAHWVDNSHPTSRQYHDVYSELQIQVLSRR